MASQDHESPDLEKGLTPRDQVSVSGAESACAAGLDHFGKQDFARAIQSFESALELNPGHLGAQKYLGLACFQYGQYEKAIRQFESLLRREPDNDQVLCYCGMAYLELSRFSEAERCLRKVVLLNPRSAEGFRNLGIMFYRRGLYNESIVMLKKAVELDPDNPETHFNLGETYNKLDEIDQAVSCFETVLKHYPENPRVFYNLGILYDKKGLPEKASLMYRQAKDLSSPRPSPRRMTVLGGSKGEDLFFSRSLNVVTENQGAEWSRLNKDRFEKFKRRQKRRKSGDFVPEEIIPLENAGTMDLTKASLKINEAIKIIKEKNKRK